MPGVEDVIDREELMFQEAAESLTLPGANNQGGNGEGGEGGMSETPTPGASTEDAPPATPPVETPPAPETPPAVPPAGAPPAVEAPAAAPVPVNYEGISNGLIKSVDDITRFANEHSALKTEVENLRKQVAEDPFANDFARTINQMQKDGKSPEQLKAFLKLQDLGEISKLSPIDAMIEAKVLRDGRNADIARKQIEKKYGITENMDPDERLVAEADMADDAKADYEYLTSQKKELATPLVRVPDPVLQTLSKEAIVSQVAPLKDKIKEQFTTLGEFDLLGKEVKDGVVSPDAIPFAIPIPAEFKESIPGLIEDFFVNAGVPPTQENLKTALEVVNFELFNKFGLKIIQDACNQTANIVAKRIRDEYENKNGKVRNPGAPPRPNANDLNDDDLQNYARGE